MLCLLQRLPLPHYLTQPHQKEHLHSLVQPSSLETEGEADVDDDINRMKRVVKRVESLLSALRWSNSLCIQKHWGEIENAVLLFSTF